MSDLRSCRADMESRNYLEVYHSDSRVSVMQCLDPSCWSVRQYLAQPFSLRWRLSGSRWRASAGFLGLRLVPSICDSGRPLVKRQVAEEWLPGRSDCLWALCLV